MCLAKWPLLGQHFWNYQRTKLTDNCFVDNSIMKRENLYKKEKIYNKYWILFTVFTWPLRSGMNRFVNIYVILWAIWYHLYNLKIVKNTYEGMLLLVKLQASVYFYVIFFKVAGYNLYLFHFMSISTTRRRRQLTDSGS